VMFVTPNELAIMYQLWSLLTEKCHLKSSTLVRNDLPKSIFSGTSCFIKTGEKPSGQFLGLIMMSH
jgi:hypothetical protein